MRLRRPSLEQLVGGSLAAVLAAGVLTAVDQRGAAENRLLRTVAGQDGGPGAPRREPVRVPGQAGALLRSAPDDTPPPAAAAAPDRSAPVAGGEPAVGDPGAGPAPATTRVRPTAPSRAPSVPSRPPAPVPAPPATAAPASGPSAAEFEDRLVAAVNAERASRGLAALRRDPCADGPARRHAGRMAAAGAPSHQELGAVLDACGGTRAAENVGRGRVTPERLVQAWMASEPHRRTVLDPALASLGSGAARGGDGHWYASHVFLGP